MILLRSSERQKLKVQPNKINMQNRKQMGSEHTCIYHACKNVGTYQSSSESSKQSFRIVFESKSHIQTKLV